MATRWIKKATNKRTKDALHRQLGIPANQLIPTGLLRKIVRRHGGKIIVNHKAIMITTLLKRRALFALNIKHCLHLIP